ncbi:carboxypeptidase-like regulatory domain-containing protein [Tunicatimonas pelagia]|uniref:carboxypeptidase-like regulatory domain-containing protein n=1 Tax=Tunicatimonas pelagia TaxID=931531 RepID=UPI002665C103|nr:carboxypeptidase-like regulatory domain-containing protein [Tunicatimonas pelagia]WKN41669.1 carboxypeptidase-like regulatory domain-containing protein [Tunicatimonas pelagia]
MIRKLLISSCFVMSALTAQSQERVVCGIVKDQLTLEPVSSVHVIGAREGTFSDQNGYFLIHTFPTDTLRFSHINYQTHTVLADSSSDTIRVFLQTNDFLLKEVTVLGLPSEERFKRQLLRTRPTITTEEIHARTNFAYSHQLFLSGYVPTMNSEDNYRWHIQEPRGITLFSSGPTGGLIKAFRNLSHNYDVPLLDKVSPSKEDSTSTERLDILRRRPLVKQYFTPRFDR